MTGGYMEGKKGAKPKKKPLKEKVREVKLTPDINTEELEELLSPEEWAEFKETFINTVANRRPDDFDTREKVKMKWSLKLAATKARKKEMRKQERELAVNLNLEMKDSIYASWEGLFEEDSESSNVEVYTNSPNRSRFSRWQIQDDSMLAMMLAVRASVTTAIAQASNNKPQSPENLSPSDFTTCTTFNMTFGGDTQKSVLRDFAPTVFRSLREISGIPPNDYLELSLWSDSSIQKENFAGKNAPTVVYSVGKKFMLRTISKDEAKSLVSILPAYYKYIKENPASLLLRIFGLHRLVRKGKRMFFIVTGNIFNHLGPQPSVDFFSIRARHGSKKKDALPSETVYFVPTVPGSPQTSTEDLATFLTDSQDELPTATQPKLQMNLLDRKTFLTQFDQDCAFLEENQLMLYELAVGISKARKGDLKKFKKGTRRARASTLKSKEELEASQKKKVPSFVFFVESPKMEKATRPGPYEPTRGTRSPGPSALRKTSFGMHNSSEYKINGGGASQESNGEKKGAVKRVKKNTQKDKSYSDGDNDDGQFSDPGSDQEPNSLFSLSLSPFFDGISSASSPEEEAVGEPKIKDEKKKKKRAKENGEEKEEGKKKKHKKKRKHNSSESSSSADEDNASMESSNSSLSGPDDDVIMERYHFAFVNILQKPQKGIFKKGEKGVPTEYASKMRETVRARLFPDLADQMK